MAKKKRPKQNEPKRLKILYLIGDHLHMVMQESQGKDYRYADKYSNMAEALIELLEEYDCGSVGGVDHGQWDTRLIARWDWLYRKYDDPTKEKFGCEIVTYKELCDYFDYDYNKMKDAYKMTSPPTPW